MVTAAHSASTTLSPDFHLSGQGRVAGRSHSVSTYLAVVAAMVILAVIALQTAVASGSGDKVDPNDPVVTSLYTRSLSR